MIRLNQLFVSIALLLVLACLPSPGHAATVSLAQLNKNEETAKQKLDTLQQREKEIPLEIAEITRRINNPQQPAQPPQGARGQPNTTGRGTAPLQDELQTKLASSTRQVSTLDSAIKNDNKAISTAEAAYKAFRDKNLPGILKADPEYVRAQADEDAAKEPLLAAKAVVLAALLRSNSEYAAARKQADSAAALLKKLRDESGDPSALMDASTTSMNAAGKASEFEVKAFAADPKVSALQKTFDAKQAATVAARIRIEKAAGERPEFASLQANVDDARKKLEQDQADLKQAKLDQSSTQKLMSLRTQLSNAPPAAAQQLKTTRESELTYVRGEIDKAQAAYDKARAAAEAAKSAAK